MDAMVKNEIHRLINQDVLEQVYDWEMASPAFFIIKSNGSITTADRLSITEQVPATQYELRTQYPRDLRAARRSEVSLFI
ncbi:hypothetical protein PC123_g24944 [Phytophthora cactorum]|nr:hypothetical protein PC120_g24393 [Phytophthora cactorum]KAG4039504.1 hypothetical protein PC123_g24944 [Phytophthora cactorum]